MMRLLTRLEPLSGLSAASRYLLTSLLILGILGVRLIAEPYLSGYPFILFIPGIIIASAVFNRGSGVLATLLSSLAATFFFVEPRYSLAIPDFNTGLVLFLFVALGFFLSALIEELRHMVTRLAGANERLEEAERQTETLLRELNHRIRNDLHGIFVLLRQLQRQHPEPAARSVTDGVGERIRLLSRVYNQLQRQHGEAVVDAAAFVQGLSKDLESALPPAKQIAVHTEAETVMLPLVQAAPLGLIINELVTNAVKHAFPDERAGTISIKLRQSGQELMLQVADNGVGLSMEPRPGSQGRRLVEALVQQLGGTLTVESPPGTSFTVRVPLNG